MHGNHPPADCFTSNVGPQPGDDPVVFKLNQALAYSIQQEYPALKEVIQEAIDSGDGDDLLDLLTKVHEIAPENAHYLLLKGRLLAGQSNYQEAVENYNAGLMLGPFSIEERAKLYLALSEQLKEQDCLSNNDTVFRYYEKFYINSESQEEPSKSMKDFMAAHPIWICGKVLEGLSREYPNFDMSYDLSLCVSQMLVNEEIKLQQLLFNKKIELHMVSEVVYSALKKLKEEYHKILIIRTLTTNSGTVDIPKDIANLIFKFEHGERKIHKYPEKNLNEIAAEIDNIWERRAKTSLTKTARKAIYFLGSDKGRRLPRHIAIGLSLALISILCIPGLPAIIAILISLQVFLIFVLVVLIFVLAEYIHQACAKYTKTHKNREPFLCCNKLADTYTGASTSSSLTGRLASTFSSFFKSPSNPTNATLKKGLHEDITDVSKEATTSTASLK